jgi:UDP-N-acetyl-D-glucosamine dehydrogenase
VDPHYLAWAARRAGVDTGFIDRAAEINAHMPAHVVERTLEALDARGVPAEGRRVLLLGLAYKPDVDSLHEAPSLRILELFAARGVATRFHDPWVALAPEGSAAHLEERASLPLDAEAVAGFDAVVLCTDHSALDLELVARSARLVVDTRDALGERMRGDPRHVRA